MKKSIAQKNSETETMNNEMDKKIEKELPKIEKDLYYYAISLCRDRDDIFAEDLVQETYLRIFINKDSFKQGTNFKAWACKILYRVFCNEYNSTKRHSEHLSYVDFGCFSPCGQFTDASDNADSELQSQGIMRAVSAQPDRLRIPFQMFYDGYSYQEIADLLNVPMGTVKRRIHDFRNNMSVSLKDYITTNHKRSA